MARIAVVSFRLGERDGVSVEAAKWIDAFRTLGHDVHTVAGSGSADVIIPELSIGATTLPPRLLLEETLRDCELVVVENLASLPLNPGARDVLYDVLHDRRALFRHHDLPWQRSQWVNEHAPRDEVSWSHVTINDISREELARHRIMATTVRNSFDCAPPRGRRSPTRAALDVGDEILVLFPSRALPRKNVAGALTLAEQLRATLWLLGPAEDGYDHEFEQIIGEARVRVKTGMPPGSDIDDAYAACDLVVVPSTWEGFGNPVLESVTHQRPLSVFNYPVLEEIRSFGFTFFDLSDVDSVRSFLREPDQRLLTNNLHIATEHFNIHNLPAQLAQILGGMGVR